MTEIIRRAPSSADRFAKAFAGFGSSLAKDIPEHLIGEREKKKEETRYGEENAAVKRLTGFDISGIRNPKIREKYIEMVHEATNQEKKGSADFKRQLELEEKKHGYGLEKLGREHGNDLQILGREHQYDLEGADAKQKREFAHKKAQLDELKQTPFWKNLPENEKGILESEILGNISAQSSKSLVNFERERESRKFIEDLEGPAEESASGNAGAPGASNGSTGGIPKSKLEAMPDHKLRGMLSDKKFSPIAQSELDRRKEERKEGKRLSERGEDAEAKRREALRAETLPIRKEIYERGQVARRNIENKERQLELIDSGKIDDPTYATIMEAIPLGLGQRFLSNETIEYKGGLVQGYGELRNLFPGATRVKEIEVLEKKIADLYLTDEQKKSIIRSSLDVAKRDLIREDVAAEMDAEGDSYGVLEYQKELEKRAKPRMDALFNKILDEQKSVIQNAENKKKIALDINDPSDKQIAQQILKEAGGDRQKARKLAKEKGYIF